MTGNGPDHTLSEIGLDFGQDGRLTMKQATLDRALGSDYRGVVAALAGSPGKDRTEGVLRTLHSDLDELTNPVTGPVTGELSALTNEGESTEKEIEHKSESLADLRDSLEEKYSNLQSLLGGLNAKQNYVSQQIAKGTL
jgi:flagellar hook-associated protein 2